MAFKQLDLFATTTTPVVEDKQLTVKTTDNILIVSENESDYSPIVNQSVPSDKLLIPKSKRGRKSNKETFTEVNQMGIPDEEVLRMKLYHPIRQVAKWFGVPASQIRFWENHFEVLKPRKNRKGDRLFRLEDIQNLKTIYYLLRIKKYSIEGAREYLKGNKKTVENNFQIIDSLNSIKVFLNELKKSLNYE